MPVWGAIALGGALGAVSRWILGVVLGDAFGTFGATGFPWGTLAANVIGCALIGVLAPMVVGRSAWLAGFIVTGFLGGFTTYSAFAEETFILLDRGDTGGVLLAAVYVVVTILATAAAVAIGARVFASRRAAS